jgi:hypothetical protein
LAVQSTVTSRRSSTCVRSSSICRGHAPVPNAPPPRLVLRQAGALVPLLSISPWFCAGTMLSSCLLFFVLQRWGESGQDGRDSGQGRPNHVAGGGFRASNDDLERGHRGHGEQ